MITFKRYLNRNVYFLFLIIYVVSLPLKSNGDFYEIYKYLHQNPDFDGDIYKFHKNLHLILKAVKPHKLLKIKSKRCDLNTF